MRIVSLVPAATEMLFALDLGDEVVGVTHECDFPPPARERVKVTRTTLPADLSSAEIDAAVKERAFAGGALYELDVEALHALAPDLIVTQTLCEVCAVAEDEVRRIAEEIQTRPMVVALDPHTVGEVLGDARTLAQAADRKDEAIDLIREASARIDRIRVATRDVPRQRVIALEWLDPPYVAGHWTPQLIEFAGGEDVVGFAGEHSEQQPWETLASLCADIIIVMPCGYDAEIAYREAEMHREQLAAIGAGRVVAVDAAAYFSRPGPRIVEGLETLAHIIHPDPFPSSPTPVLAIEL
jgi:iron complex transport system substrate-binding protein